VRFLKFFLAIAIVLAAVAAGAGIGLRAGRGKFGAVSEVKPDFVAVTNTGFISLFAARVAPGPHVVVFDTGLDPQARPVDALLGALHASRDDVTDVFLTHGHVDHVAGAGALAKAKLHLGVADVALAAGQASPEMLLPRLLGKLLATPPVTANAPMTGAATFEIGAADAAKTVKAFPVPGHTAGSYAFLYDGVLVVGDTMLFKEGRLVTPPRVFDPHPAENAASLIALKKQLANETIDVVCTAHGGCTPKGLGRTLLDDLIARLGD
jgi:glyoxylase-like metal-dependent hydrolase (beta-lactamase superfamily II)